MTTLEETLAKALQVSREALERDEKVTLDAICDWLQSRGLELAARYVRHRDSVTFLIDMEAQRSGCACGRMYWPGGRNSHRRTCRYAHHLRNVYPREIEDDRESAYAEALVEARHREFVATRDWAVLP